MPAQPYSEFQGIFDFMPYIKAIEAKKKAQDEALTKYYKGLDLKVNTAGVRSQDLIDPKDPTRGIQADIDKAKEYAINNRVAIAKGGPEKIEYDRMIKQIELMADRSRNTGALEKDMGKAYFEGTYRPKSRDLNVLNKLGLSIYDTNHYQEDGITQYGWQNTSKYIPALNANERATFQKSLIGPATLVSDYTKSKKFKDYTIVPKFYTKESLKSAADGAMTFIEPGSSDPYKIKLENYYDDLKDNAQFLAEVTPLFKQYYGQDREILTSQDAAAADILREYSKAQGEEKFAPKSKGTSKAAQAQTGGEIRYLLQEYNNSNGIDLDVTVKGVTKRRRLVPVSEIDPGHYNIITDDGSVEPITINDKQPDGSYIRRQYFIVDPATNDWYGAGNTKISNEAVKDRYVEKYASSAYKGKAGTKAKEATPGVSAKKPSADLIAPGGLDPNQRAY